MGLRYLKFVGFLAVCLLAACDSFEHLFFEQVRVQMDETDSVTISCAVSRFNGDLLVDVTVSNGCAYAVNLPTSEACITVDGDPVTLLSSLGVSLATNVLPYSSLQSSARVITRGSRQSLMDAARHGRLGMMIVIENTTSTNRISVTSENHQQVFSRSVSETSKLLHTGLCSIRIPYFHVTEASASDILKFIEDVYNEYTDPIWNRHASPKPKQSILDLSGMESEFLSSKITRNIEDVTLMRMLHEVCAEIDVEMGLLDGKIVFAKRPEGVSASEMCQPRFWPGGKLPEAIITRNDQYVKSSKVHSPQ